MLKKRLAFGLLFLVACNDAVSPPPGGDPGGLGVAAIELQPLPILILPGESFQLKATVRNASGAIIPNAPITWTSSNPEVSVSSSGLATVSATTYAGPVTISARSENISESETGKVCGRGTIATTRSQFRVFVEPGALGEGFWQDKQLLFAGGTFYGTSAADLIVPAAMLGNINHANLLLSVHCDVDIAGGQYTRTLIRLHDTAPQARVRAMQETFSPNLPGVDRALLIRYTFTNTSDTPITGFRVGVAFDWDLAFIGNGGNDYARWNATLQAAETFEADSSMAGAVAIGAAVTMYRGVGDTWPRNAAEHFDEFSKGISNAVIGARDVGQILGFGPFDIPAGASHSLTVGLAFGLTPAEFATRIDALRQFGRLFPSP